MAHHLFDFRHSGIQNCTCNSIYTQNFTITNVKVSLQESQGFSLLQVLSNQDTYQSDIPVNMNPYGPKLHTDIYISQGSSEQWLVI